MVHTGQTVHLKDGEKALNILTLAYLTLAANISSCYLLTNIHSPQLSVCYDGRARRWVKIARHFDRVS